VKSEQDTQNVINESSSPYYAKIQKIATQSQLGQLRASYTQSTVSGTRLLINAIVWFVVSLIGLYFLIETLRKITLQSTLSDPPTLRSIGAIGVISLVVLFGCFLQGWRNLREYRYRHREQVHIFEDGFVFLEGHEQSYALRWDKIEILLRGRIDPKHPKRIARNTLTFIEDNDEAIVFAPKVQQSVELCDTIERAYTDYRSPGMLELYRLGEELDFSNLIIGQDGVTHLRTNGQEEENISWAEINTFEIGEIFTRITLNKMKDKFWFEELTSDIGNVLILKELLPSLRSEDV
jgi:hypothetical protein